MTELTAIQSFAILVIATAGFVEAIKRGFTVPTKFLPLISIAVGVVVAIIAKEANFVNIMGVEGFEGLMGGIIGLSACGLFDGAMFFKK